ncbi:hypothetical protein NCCP691_20530 [Noviherbaspirillum aridicola]|uniref:Uncharacterized protein n=1 Tax=Noviherbaspirillum aridicola TaxID=2849687 RepID=A0ABQ4Q5P6_9BURK|nr:hypothetical protein NCCP691_20530 [Noviherbaspirillum aridicola]
MFARIRVHPASKRSNKSNKHVETISLLANEFRVYSFCAVTTFREPEDGPFAHTRSLPHAGAEQARRAGAAGRDAGRHTVTA